MKDTVTEMAELNLDASRKAKEQTVFFPWLEHHCIPESTKLSRGCCWDACRSLRFPTFHLTACKKENKR